MQILLVYGTQEGQTQKIAGFVADRLTRQGHKVMTGDASAKSALPDPRRFDAILVAASVHVGRYQCAVIDYVREHRATISARANASCRCRWPRPGTSPRMLTA
jgi:menaquinone-dependent protoporphyrinogen oxidase